MTLKLLCHSKTKERILNTLYKEFLHNFNITIQLGAELEFYLSDSISLKELSELFSHLINEEGIIFEKERGQNQYELKLPVIDHPIILAKKIINIKNIMTAQLALNNIEIIFSAKPYYDQPGSALHIHLSLWQDKKNLLAKDKDIESNIMLQIVGSMCKLMLESSILFAPTENCYKRFIKNFEAPTTVSWGGNNRTTALRIPASNSFNRRIEYRLASAASDPFLVLIAILIAVYYGLQNKITAPIRIYGNASDNQYNLQTLPKSLLEALSFFENSKIIKPWIFRLIN